VIAGTLSHVPTATIGSAGVVRLRAGRAVTFVAAGPADGFPVVYGHGAIGSPRWHTPGLDAALERLSIRYLVVNRPGFGGSDPAPGRTVADHANDVGELMTMLGHRRFSVVGVSAGAPYALACGWALADSLVALAAGRAGLAHLSLRAPRAPAPDLPTGDDRRLPRVPAPLGLSSG
jgi:pimeloyl-ACP methyl ester carboxylesterase